MDRCEASGVPSRRWTDDPPTRGDHRCAGNRRAQLSEFEVERRLALAAVGRRLKLRDSLASCDVGVCWVTRADGNA